MRENAVFTGYAADFAGLSERDLLRTLIDIGDELQPFPEKLKTTDNEVTGCQSAAYIHTTTKDNKLQFAGWADARTTRGFIAILCEAFSGMAQEEFLTQGKKQFEEFLAQTNMQQHLVPSRQNGLLNAFLLMQQQAKNMHNTVGK